MKTQVVRAVAATGMAAMLLSCSRAPDTDPRMVSEWMNTLYGIVRAERISPPLASRVMGYASVALYEGLAAATPGLPSLAGTLNGLPELSRAGQGERHDPTLVAVEAERVLLDSILAGALPTTQATLARLVDSLRASRRNVARGVRERSELLGQAIGNAIVAWSRSDGFDSTRGRPYATPVGPGLWVNDTPVPAYTAQNLSAATQFVALDNPNSSLQSATASDRGLIMNRPKDANAVRLPAVKMTGVTEPYWGRLRPFMLRAWDECRIEGPPAYAVTPESPFYQEALEVYQIQASLTPEQKMIALYWADNPGETATPAGHWVAIAARLVERGDITAGDAARLFAATGMAVADAFIATWGYKFRHNLIRPRTYIRQVIDPAWEPLLPTPPFPEYPSGHSSQSAAAAAVMQAIVGDAEFEDATEVSIGHPIRTFSSPGAAADEAGLSRIYAGIHFRSGNLGGQALGRCIAGRIIERMRGIGTGE